MNPTPCWPGVIQHRDDDELIYIDSQHSWSGDDELCRWRYDEDDRLIDATGSCFSLKFDADRGLCELVATPHSVSLQEFSVIIQRHLFALAQTCITKVVLENYLDGFRTLRALES